MGTNNSKSKIVENQTCKLHATNSSRYSSLSRPHSFLSSCAHEHDSNTLHFFNQKRRICSKKKVLILGLDGVGKTDFFTQIISQDKQRSKVESFPRPTIGYNVETIPIRCHHLCHRRYHKITLWDCGGDSSIRSLWSYHYSNTSLLVWIINIHDRSRLDLNLQLLSHVLTNPLLYQVPLLIVLYNLPFEKHPQGNFDGDSKQNILTNLEVAFRFLATLSTSRASTFQWRVINVTFDQSHGQTDMKKLRQCFQELMDL